jgi:hypothetical protein
LKIAMLGYCEVFINHPKHNSPKNKWCPECPYWF